MVSFSQWNVSLQEELAREQASLLSWQEFVVLVLVLVALAWVVVELRAWRKRARLKRELQGKGEVL